MNLRLEHKVGQMAQELHPIEPVDREPDHIALLAQQFSFLREMLDREQEDQQRTSCVRRPKGRSIVIHDFFGVLCEWNHYAAILIRVFIGEHLKISSDANTSFIQYCSIEDLRHNMLHCGGRGSVSSATKLLINKGFIHEHHRPPNFRGYEVDLVAIENSFLLLKKGVDYGVPTNDDPFARSTSNYDSLAVPSIDPATSVLPVKKGFIYAVKLDALIKIGYSSAPKARIASYRCSNLRVEELFVSTVKITISDEKAFHNKYNMGKEQYSLDRQPELMAALVAFEAEIGGGC